MKLCARCVLPETFPGVSFDIAGICQYCREQKSIDFVYVRQRVEEYLHQLARTPARYHAALAFSGGKDSSYALWYLRRNFPLRIQALTIDNGFVSERARQNCLAVTGALEVDHQFIAPPPTALKSIYRTSLEKEVHSSTALTRGSQVCSSCIQVINTQLLNHCAEQTIPVLAGGYIGGQVPSHTGFMKLTHGQVEIARRSFLEHLARVLPDAAALELFRYRGGPHTQTVILNPLVFLRPSEDEIVAKLTDLGWIAPLDTGRASSNCLLNDYAIQNHLQRYKFHPYAFELATSVREGLLSREAALKKLEVNLTDEYVRRIESKLGAI